MQARPTAKMLQDCFVKPPADFSQRLDHEYGYVIVAEDRTKPDGRKVELGYVRISSSADHMEAPFFMMAGGPGSTLLKPDVFRFFAKSYLGSPSRPCIG